MKLLLNIVLLVSFAVVSSTAIFFFKHETVGHEKVDCCGENAEYVECAPICPLTCPTLNKFHCYACKAGCQCKEGYILADDNGPCIPRSQCPPMAE